MFAPALKIADEGFEISPRLFSLLNGFKRFARGERFRGYFYDAAGEPHPVGYRLKNPDYAATLRLRMAAKGWRTIAGLDQPELRMRVQFARLANVERLKLMYRFELSLLAEPVRDELLIALATLISFESWDQMRHSFGLSTEAAQAVWRSAIDRMLP